MPEKPQPSISEFISNGEYSLIRGVLFIAGAMRGAIYDLNTGRVFSVDNTACEVLVGNLNDGGKFWDKLVSLNLATRETIRNLN